MLIQILSQKGRFDFAGEDGYDGRKGQHARVARRSAHT